MREKLLESAERLVQTRGLNAASFQQLADEVGLSKASVFHHFRNKDDLVLSLIDWCESKYGPKYDAIIDEGDGAPAKLERIAREFEAELSEQGPCLLAAVGGSFNTLSPAVAVALRQATEHFVARFASVFQQGVEDGTLQFDGEAADAATGFFAMMQGLQLLVRAKADVHAFRRAADAYLSSLKSTV